VDAPSLEAFKARFDGAWGFEQPGLVEGVLARSRGIGTGICKL